MKQQTYIEFIKDAIETEGWHVANRANKAALEMKAITIEQYSEAASLIADAYLNK